ncbi:NAD-dependent dihydropyrimidine dehydrogenase subunit PreT [invertebrate metagenome]|uniref:NAD-dependent dihydropyrimidine dehydrogenase subunit PreT n=1 Tax=invertebrate metagenome TaxID=1711999 RepID=A0A2H9T636_9ZZZZ
MLTGSKTMTPVVDLKEGRQGTGPVTEQMPVWTDKTPPCVSHCPAGNDVRKWVKLAKAGQDQAAWEALVNENPLACVQGRVCYHPCQSGCNRAFVNGGINIHAIERYLGDKALENGWTMTEATAKTGKHVLIVGSGPAGLSCAWHLARLGHDVTVREASAHPGGMLRYGIPAYRLPKDILDNEVARIEAMGVKFEYNTRVDDVNKARTEEHFDAVFTAVGAQTGKMIPLAGHLNVPVVDAVTYLHNVTEDQSTELGKRVVVYGGGNTAMDVCRTLKRRGHDPIVIFRYSRDLMEAHKFEADEAIEEDIEFHFLRTIENIEGDKFTLRHQKLKDDAATNPEKIEALDETSEIQADAIIMALGQAIDSSLLESAEGLEKSRWGEVLVNDDMQTTVAGIFAGGDMVQGDKNATTALGHGRRAAKKINAWLTDTQWNDNQGSDVLLKELNLWYRPDTEQQKESMRDPFERMRDFHEVVSTLSEEEIRREAGRCFSCGQCYECDGCYAACPEKAITRLGNGNLYKVNMERCTGCGDCVVQCPSHAIHMVPFESAESRSL